MNTRKKTFRVATSVGGKQFRMNLGYWPLMSVDEARGLAMQVLAQCRRGERPTRPAAPAVLPTLRQVSAEYCRVKNIKASSQGRYESFFRTHFADWLDRPVSEWALPEFSAHCQSFAQSKGAALVALGRGVIGALVRYANALHSLELVSPFVKLAAVGLMPDRVKPRARVLQERDLPAWKAAIDLIGEVQRDYLLLVLYTGLRRNEARDMKRHQSAGTQHLAGRALPGAVAKRTPPRTPAIQHRRDAGARARPGVQIRFGLRPARLCTRNGKEASQTDRPYTYPQPRPSSSASTPWSKFNRHRWSKFNRREQIACYLGATTR